MQLGLHMWESSYWFQLGRTWEFRLGERDCFLMPLPAGTNQNTLRRLKRLIPLARDWIFHQVCLIHHLLHEPHDEMTLSKAASECRFLVGCRVILNMQTV